MRLILYFEPIKIKKGKKGEIVMQFTAEKIKINTDNPNKWYVSYTIKYIDGVTKYPKVYGGEYGIRLNDNQDDERRKKADRLFKAVKQDLALGIDPKSKLDLREQELMAGLAISKGIPYDEATKIMIDYYQWNDPIESAKLTAHNSKIFFNASFRKFVTSIGKLDDVKSITKNDISDWLLAKNKAGDWNLNTCKNKVGTISQLFIPLVDSGLLDNNPCKGIVGIKRKLKRNPQKRVKKRYEVWTDAELKEFVGIANCVEHRFEYALAMTCYYLFIRRSECFRLKLGSLDLLNRKFVIDSDITKSARKFDSSTLIHLPIHPKLGEILTTYIEQRFGEDLNNEYYLFPSIKNKLKAYPYFQYDVDYKNKLGYKLTNGKVKYDLKHTGVSHFWREQVAQGEHVALILARLQKLCRHSTPQQTMTYLSTECGIDIDDGFFNTMGVK